MNVSVLLALLVPIVRSMLMDVKLLSALQTQTALIAMGPTSACAKQATQALLPTAQKSVCVIVSHASMAVPVPTWVTITTAPVLPVSQISGLLDMTTC